jgi:hypothetical protein
MARTCTHGTVARTRSARPQPFLCRSPFPPVCCLSFFSVFLLFPRCACCLRVLFCFSPGIALVGVASNPLHLGGGRGRHVAGHCPPQLALRFQGPGQGDHLILGHLPLLLVHGRLCRDVHLLGAWGVPRCALVCKGLEVRCALVCKGLEVGLFLQDDFDGPSHSHEPTSKLALSTLATPARKASTSAAWRAAAWSRAAAASRSCCSSPATVAPTSVCEASTYDLAAPRRSFNAT